MISRRAIALNLFPILLMATGPWIGALSVGKEAIASDAEPVETEAVETEAAETEAAQTEAGAEMQVAAVPRVLNLAQFPLEMDLLASGQDLSHRGIITNQTISQTELTTPSLWWTQDQFGGKLLEHWVAYSGTDGSPRRVDLVVDRQLWGLSTYLERYTFVNRFGSVAKDFGYSVRVFNDHGDPLATYVCTFPGPPSAESGEALETQRIDTSSVSCAIGLDSSGAGALRGRSNSFELFF